MSKRKTLTFVMLVFFSCGYFSCISHIETNEFLKSEILLIPVQLAMAIYMTYLRWGRHYHSAELDN